MPKYSFDFRYAYGSWTLCNLRYEHYDIDATSEKEAFKIAEKQFNVTHKSAICDLYRDSDGWHKLLW